MPFSIVVICLYRKKKNNANIKRMSDVFLLSAPQLHAIESYCQQWIKRS